MDAKLATTHIELYNDLFGALDEKMAHGENGAVPSNRSSSNTNTKKVQGQIKEYEKILKRLQESYEQKIKSLDDIKAGGSGVDVQLREEVKQIQNKVQSLEKGNYRSGSSQVGNGGRGISIAERQTQV